MTTKTHLAALAIAPLLAGCVAHAPSAKSAIARRDAPAAQRAELDRRELPPLERHMLALPEFTAASESAEPPQSAEGDTGPAVVIPIGAETTIRCFFPKPAPVAEVLERTIHSASAGVRVRSVETTNVAPIGNDPAVLVDLQYDTTRGDTSEPGELKVLLFSHPERPVLCMHDAIGYRATFERISRGFAASLEPLHPKATTPTLVAGRGNP
jgi:hypothetical protein